MSQCDCNNALMVRKWIGDVSAERVGQVWRAEDHEALIRTMRAADELTLALVALERRDLDLSTCTIRVRRHDFHKVTHHLAKGLLHDVPVSQVAASAPSWQMHFFVFSKARLPAGV